MSILITNITEGQPDDGLDRYIVRINKKEICKFSHERKINGLAQCLRDAADAVDAQRTLNNMIMIDRFCNGNIQNNK